MPVDWPRTYDIFAAFDENGDFLVNLHSDAVADLIDGSGRLTHPIILDFEDDLERERRITCAPFMSLDLTVRVNIVEGVTIVNPDRLVSKDDLRAALKATAMRLMGGR